MNWKRKSVYFPTKLREFSLNVGRRFWTKLKPHHPIEFTTLSQKAELHLCRSRVQCSLIGVAGEAWFRCVEVAKFFSFRCCLKQIINFRLLLSLFWDVEKQGEGPVTDAVWRQICWRYCWESIIHTTGCWELRLNRPARRNGAARERASFRWKKWVRVNLDNNHNSFHETDKSLLYRALLLSLYHMYSWDYTSDASEWVQSITG